MTDIIKFKDCIVTQDEIIFEESTLKILFKFVNKKLSIWLEGARNKRELIRYYRVVENVCDLQKSYRIKKYPFEKIELTIKEPIEISRKLLWEELTSILQEVMSDCIIEREKGE